MIEVFIVLLVLMILITIAGNIYTVLRERRNLRNHQIVLYDYNISQKDIDAASVKMFEIDGNLLKIGDVVTVFTRKKTALKGTVIGLTDNMNTLLMIAKNSTIERIRLDIIQTITVESRYGYFN